MMQGRSVYFRIGLLLIGGGALLVALIWFLGGARISHGVLFESYFSETVQGLEVGAPVKYRGVTLGRVTEIGLVSAEYGRNQPIDIQRQTYRLVFVRYLIDPTKVGRLPDTAVAVQTGLRARLASQGITGLSYIELDFVDPARYPALDIPWEPKANNIPSMPSTLTQVQDAAQQVLSKLNNIDIEAVATSITGLVNDMRAELKSGDVRDTLARAETLLQTLNDAVRGADLPALSDDLKRTSGSMRDVLAGNDMRRLINNASAAVDRLSNVVAKLPPVIAGLQTTAQRAGNSTADVEQALIPLMRDLQATASNLRDVTESLRQNPAQVLSQPPPRSAGSTR